jgi:hypothetical protein
MEHTATFCGLVPQIVTRTAPQSIVWTPHNFGLDEPQGPLGKQTLGGPIKLCVYGTRGTAVLVVLPGLAQLLRPVGTDAGSVTGTELFGDAVSTAWPTHVGLTATVMHLQILVCVLTMLYQVQRLFSWRVWGTFLIR